MTDKARLLQLTTEIVAAYVRHNSIPAANLVALIGSTAKALGELGQAVPEAKPEAQKPAVPIRKSITPDYLVSLEDGMKFKSLKRALMARHGLTPAQYREKWGLPDDYPMVAPNYRESRSALAKANGLGRKPEVAVEPVPSKPVRKKLGLSFGKNSATA